MVTLTPKLSMNYRGQTMEQADIQGAKVVIQAGDDGVVNLGSRNEKKQGLYWSTGSIRYT